MSNVENLTKNIAFYEAEQPASLTLNNELGFMQVAESTVALRGITLIGFGRPLDRSAGMHDRHVLPITEFDQLPDSLQTIDAQGKGVGARMYNTAEAYCGAKVLPETVDVFSFTLNPTQILNKRIAQGGTLTQISSHAKRIFHAKTTSVADVVEGVHADYGNAQAVNMKVPAHPRLRQKLHGVKNPEEVQPQFMLIRDPKVTLTRVGEVSVADLLRNR